MSNDSSSSDGVAGVGMVVAAYVDEMAADQALDAMKQAKKDGSFYFDDAVVVRQDAKGKVHIKETGDMSSGKGAGIGGLIGGVIGLLGGRGGRGLGRGHRRGHRRDRGASRRRLQQGFAERTGQRIGAGQFRPGGHHQQGLRGRRAQADSRQ